MKPEISEYVKRFGLDKLLGHVQDEDQSGNYSAVDPKFKAYSTLIIVF